MGLHQLKVRQLSLFIFRSKSTVILPLVYVDNVVLIGSNIKVVNRMIGELAKRFALKDLGRLNYFLGIQVHYMSFGVILNQAKYVDDLLKNLELKHLKLVPSLSVIGKRVSVHDGKVMEDPFLYRSTIGALQYLTHMRPDIAHVVNQPSQFLTTPIDLHWQMEKRVLRYVSGTKHLGLLFQPSTKNSTSAFLDANWASNIDDRRSVAAYCVFVGSNLVSWSSKKQLVVARSSTESEYRALALASTKIIWIQQLLTEIGCLFPLTNALV